MKTHLFWAHVQFRSNICSTFERLKLIFFPSLCCDSEIAQLEHIRFQEQNVAGLTIISDL